MGQLRPQGVQSLLIVQALTDVADEAGEQTLAGSYGFANSELDRDFAPIGGDRGQQAVVSDDPLVAGGEIPGQIACVLILMLGGGQDRDVSTDHLFGGIAEQLFGRATERQDLTCFVDHHHRVRHCLQDRHQLRFTRLQTGLTLLPLRDVHIHAERTDQFARLVVKSAGGSFDRSRRPIGLIDPELKAEPFGLCPGGVVNLIVDGGKIVGIYKRLPSIVIMQRSRL